MEIFTCAQGAPEWHEARRGIPTASEFSTVMAKGEGKTRRTYMLKLAGERLTGQCAESFSSAHMERGKTMEEEARELYAFRAEVEPQLVGFIRDGDMGCSPDALIGEAGALEIKTALPHILIEYLLKDEFPSVHRAQTQGVLLVAKLEWIDLSIYWPKIHPLTKRAVRDEPYIANMRGEIDRFNDELAELVRRVERYGAPPEAVAA
jgi:hypothetical protein